MAEEKENKWLSIFKRRFLTAIILALLVFAGLLFFADISKLGQILTKFKWVFLPLILTLTLLDDILRFVKWNYFLSIVGVNLSIKESAIVFFGGLAMAITPGKVGELLKAFLVKQLEGKAMSQIMPVVVVERLTDFMAVTILASIGGAYFQYGITALIVVATLALVFILIVQSRRLSLWIIERLESIPFAQRFSKSARDFYESSYQLLKFRRLVISTGISLFSWGSECLALYLVFYALGVPQGFLLSTFIFSFSSIMGAVSMLPGGLGVAEGSMTSIMVLLAGLEKQFAVAATLLIRLSTLWFAVFIGLGTLMWNRQRFELAGLEES